MGKNEEPLSLNRYTYCYNNPIAYIDPTGFDSYIFYLEEWEKEALADKKTIESRYDSEVHLKPVKNAQDFIEEWYSMGTVNNQAVSIDTVF